MKSFAEFYRQVSRSRLLREDNMAGKAVSAFGMGAGDSDQSGDVELGMGADPIPLSKFASNPEIAQSLAKGGGNDNNPSDDKITAKFTPIQPSLLSPTQATLVSDKVKGMIETGITKPEFLSNMQAIVSEDNAIMDGHHRWAAALVLYPNKNVNVLKMNLPLKKLITVLNAYTVGELGVMQGNSAKGESIAEAFENLKNKVRQISPELLAKIEGANGDSNTGLNILLTNIDNISAEQKQNKTNLPREEMPVVPPDGMDKDAVLQALAKAANDGMLDIKSPLSAALRKALSDSGVAAYSGVTTGKANPTTINAPKMDGQSSQQNTNNASSSAVQFQPNQNFNKSIQTSAPNAGGANMGGTTPALQTASTFHPGLSMNEQLLVLSGVLTIEQAENNLKKRRKR
jgi:hypothetical protein